MKTLPVETVLFHVGREGDRWADGQAGRQAGRQADRQTDLTKLIVAFRNSANASKNTRKIVMSLLH